MPRNPSVRLSRSSSGLGASGVGGASTGGEMDGWAAGALFLAAGVGWASYAPHYVIAHHMSYAVSSTSPSIWASFTRQFELGALREEAKLIDARARRLKQPLGLCHPGTPPPTAFPLSWRFKSFYFLSLQECWRTRPPRLRMAWLNWFGRWAAPLPLDPPMRNLCPYSP
jgi:hypothetical protein